MTIFFLFSIVCILVGILRLNKQGFSFKLGKLSDLGKKPSNDKVGVVYLAFGVLLLLIASSRLLV